MSAPVLKKFINLWTLRNYPLGSEQGEWTDDRKIAAVKDAGVDGFQWFARPEFGTLAARHGLNYLGLCDADATNYRQRLADFVPLRPSRINIQFSTTTRCLTKRCEPGSN